MSGYNAFSDPLLIPERLYELNYDETALFKKVYEKFGRRVFDTNEFNEICLEYGLCPSMESAFGMVCDGVETGIGTGKRPTGVGNV